MGCGGLRGAVAASDARGAGVPRTIKAAAASPRPRPISRFARETKPPISRGRPRRETSRRRARRLPSVCGQRLADTSGTGQRIERVSPRRYAPPVCAADRRLSQTSDGHFGELTPVKTRGADAERGDDDDEEEADAGDDGDGGDDGVFAMDDDDRPARNVAFAEPPSPSLDRERRRLGAAFDAAAPPATARPRRASPVPAASPPVRRRSRSGSFGEETPGRKPGRERRGAPTRERFDALLQCWVGCDARDEGALPNLSRPGRQPNRHGALFFVRRGRVPERRRIAECNQTPRCLQTRRAPDQVGYAADQVVRYRAGCDASRSRGPRTTAASRRSRPPCPPTGGPARSRAAASRSGAVLARAARPAARVERLSARFGRRLVASADGRGV